MTCDPNWSDVVLFLNMAGTNGSTTFVDTSPVGNTMSSSLGAEINTSVQLSGLNSAFIPAGHPSAPGAAAAGIYASITSGAPLDILDNSNGDFTIEGFVYFPDIGGDKIAFDYGNQINGYSSGAPSFALHLETTTGDVQLNAVNIPGWGNIVWGGETFLTATWYHFAVVRASGRGYVYFNGVNSNTGSIPTWTGYPGPPSASVVIVGGSGVETGNNETSGLYIADVKVTKGVALYTSNFTPPTILSSGSCTQTVPNVVGLLDPAAQAALTGVGITVGTITEVPNPADPTQVLSQSTPGGTSITLPYTVDLTESSGVEVPNIVNVSVPIATSTLIAAGFVLGSETIETSGIIIAGNIISQNPAGGSFAAEGTSVDVVVSSGLPTPTVPDLFGLTQDEAVTFLESLGLAVGAIGSAPSQFVGVGEVQSQNPSAGASVALGTVVSFVLSAGVPVVGTIFDFEATVISQYANSPTIMQLCNNLNQYVDQSTNFANFFNYVWNVLTAVGFGLDIWGTIVNVGRLLQISNSTEYIGFYMPSESQPDQDYTPMGSDQDNPPIGGAMYTGYNATQAYLLPDDAYRQLILAKAFANICATTAPAINQILQNLYGAGTAYVLNTGPMAISYNLTFTPTPTQLAILEQSGVIPTPPGVAVTINTGV